ncbi:hypothetical protein BABINDRAFT_25071, partial [Babjeviella inositovora NRRL Y-12698]
VSFFNFFLRDADKSAESYEPTCRQKIFSTSELDYNVKPLTKPQIVSHPETNELGLQIEWSDGVNTVYDHSFLRKFSKPELIKKGKNFESERVFWNLQDFAKVESELVDSITFKDYMANDEVYYNTLNSLNKYGVVYVNDIPEGNNFIMEDGKWAIEHLVERVGHIRETFYGKLFDVKTEPNAKNLAFTANKLPLHADLMYYEAPPGIQILHALQNSTKGGENVFCDAFLGAQHVKEMDPTAYEALKTVPINFHKIGHDDQYFSFSRPIVVENLEGGLTQVNYSPANMAPFEFGITSANPEEENIFKDFLRGLKIFEQFINDPVNQIVVKTKEGSAVVFNNRRVLHTRKKYQETEKESFRWLKGAYLDMDTFESQLRILKKSY